MNHQGTKQPSRNNAVEWTTKYTKHTNGKAGKQVEVPAATAPNGAYGWETAISDENSQPRSFYFRVIRDTTPAAWGDKARLSQRFGPHIGDVSPLQHLDTNMPPTLMFHGHADPTVPYRLAIALHDQLVAMSNTCVFITMPGGGHGIPPDWKNKSRDMIQEFLKEQKILAAVEK